ncbi:hypothetical protein [Paenarthrobacter ureafaciens]|uniref:hypothetical protein n=1 Tax=Paenarthrobacter ureafaciens TaxID=37931 RepID=UPI002DB8A383|nr:hypothetical protein [Paenarthrobacter ureafaciens]MEC3854280.1 hypothetical protein [Paenarthrobacter ureafaciens]
MSNSSGAKASREEEIAFLIMENVLGVDIHLADAGAGNKKPDGAWAGVGAKGRRGIVEITSPPDKELLKKWAKAKRDGKPQSESGSISLRLNELDQVCTELLDEDWARENIAKLRAEPADERHLFLFGRSHRVESYFYRLSDESDEGLAEPVGDLVLSEGLSSVWFRGKAVRRPDWGIRVWVARFQAGSGWHRHAIDIDERCLPSPNPGLVDDTVPSELRTPKDRSR